MSEACCAGSDADSSRLRFTLVPPSRPTRTMADDVREGLLSRPRELHPKYFYDERGSQLFDRICDTPEYYPTRTEDALLRQHAADIVAHCAPDNMLELGSGTSRKTRHLLDAWGVDGATYFPFDVSAEMLESVASLLAAEYPQLSVHGLVGDYTAGFGNFPQLHGDTLALFLGSTLGNFAPDFADHFLVEFVSHLERGHHFLIGADLDKDPAVIEAAYNDAEGITAAFNRNVLAVINRELGGNFDLQAFAHRAVYNRRLRRIEMYLDSLTDQRVAISALGAELELRAGEAILTEISRKFTLEELDAMLGAAGLTTVRRYVARDFPYALVLARK